MDQSCLIRQGITLLAKVVEICRWRIILSYYSKCQTCYNLAVMCFVSLQFCQRSMFNELYYYLSNPSSPSSLYLTVSPFNLQLQCLSTFNRSCFSQRSVRLPPCKNLVPQALSKSSAQVVLSNLTHLGLSTPALFVDGVHY